MVIHQLLPSGRVEFVLHGIESFGVVHPGVGKAVSVHRNTADARDHAAEVVVVGIEFGGQDQHGMVEGELGLGRGVLPESSNAGRDFIGGLLRPSRGDGQCCDDCNE